MYHIIGWLAYLGIGVQDRSRFNGVVDVIHAIGLILMMAGATCLIVIALAWWILPTNIFTGIAMPLSAMVTVIGTIVFGASRRY
jgi:hypothetical protein